MDKPRSVERKRRRTVAKIKLKHATKSVDSSADVTKKFNITGVEKLKLTPIAQRAVGCVVGENVTSETPWVYIEKEKISDNLDLHEESSEFLPIKNAVIDYPEDKILFGFNATAIDDSEEFYICTTMESKNEIIEHLDKELHEMQERLQKSLKRIPGPWSSLGSEVEVDENQIRNQRPLMEIEFKTKFPLRDSNIRFSMRPVEAAVDGYVELLSARYQFENVHRRKVDAAIQVGLQTKAVKSQTDLKYPTNVFTQYEYAYEEQSFASDTNKNFMNFINERMDKICDKIVVNKSINLYTDDYNDLKHDMSKHMPISYRDAISFIDVMTCKGKYVGSLSWHAMISGLVVAAYTKTPINSIISSIPNRDVVLDTIYEDHLALIWCYSSTLTPKLYLHAPREVTCVSFCPYDGNLVIGGCDNGQVIIWDITNRLEKVETEVILAPIAMQNRVILNSKMKWMKNTLGDAHLQPTALSALDDSHRGTIRDIVWLSPEHEVTKNGQIIQVEPNDWNLQFLTGGDDGVVLVWDLKKKPANVPLHFKKKSKRLKERPPALTEDLSKYKSWNNLFIPVYKIGIDNQGVKVPISNLTIKNHKYLYTPQNPETLNSLFDRTYFNISRSNEPFIFEPDFLITTTIGQVMKCSWAGFNFDLGQKVNSESCRAHLFPSIHDGPIRVCLMNPFFRQIFLTVGGKVFAIWFEGNLLEPMFWRKGNEKYTGGNWSVYHAFVIVLSCYDCRFEIWDLSISTLNPRRDIQFLGNNFMNSFSESRKEHSRKKTFCATDFVGTIKIFKIPDFLTVPRYDTIKIAHKMIRRLELRRSTLKKWIETLKEQNDLVEQVEPEVHAIPEPVESVIKKSESQHKVEVMDAILGVNKWKEKQEQIMYETLLEQKKLNLAEIEQQKIPLQKLAAEKRARIEKAQQKLNEKDKIFQAAKGLFLAKVEIERRRSLKVPESINELITPSYILESYKQTEVEALKSIKRKRFHYVFDWAQMINDGKDRRRMMAIYGPSKLNIYEKRYMNNSNKLFRTVTE